MRKNIFKKTDCFCFFYSTLKIFLGRSQLRNQGEEAKGTSAPISQVI